MGAVFIGKGGELGCYMLAVDWAFISQAYSLRSAVVILDCLLEDLGLHGLLAQQALEFSKLAHGIG